MTRRRAALFSMLFLLTGCESIAPDAERAGTLAVNVVVPPQASASALDEGRVYIEGAWGSRTFSVTPGTSRTIDNVPPGTYTVALEGVTAGDVERYGETSGIVVTAGQNTNANVTLNTFAPPVLNSSSLPQAIETQATFNAQFSAVSGATAYRVEFATNSAFTGATTTETTQTTVPVPASAEGALYIRVRAKTRFGSVGRASNTGSVTVVATASTLRVRARDAFALALGGNATEPGEIVLGGLLADEWIHSGQTTALHEIDLRAINIANPALTTVFRNLQRAYGAARFASQRSAANDPEKSEMDALAGFVLLQLADDYCSGVPILSYDGAGRPTANYTLRTTQQLYDDAIVLFNSALSGSGSVQVQNLARVGRARALLGKNDVAGAAGTAATVPTNFSYTIQPAGSLNGIYNFNIATRQLSLASQEGAVGVAFMNNDPRVVWRRLNGTQLGADNSTAQYDLLKYPNATSTIVLASGTEARLIEAEATVRSGNIAGAANTLNSLRASLPLTLLTPTTFQQALQLVIDERARWLVATGHRLADLRRSGFSFPSGAYPKGNLYGTEKDLPLPIEPESNPGNVRCQSRT